MLYAVGVTVNISIWTILNPPLSGQFLFPSESKSPQPQPEAEAEGKTEPKRKEATPEVTRPKIGTWRSVEEIEKQEKEEKEKERARATLVKPAAVPSAVPLVTQTTLEDDGNSGSDSGEMGGGLLQRNFFFLLVWPQPLCFLFHKFSNFIPPPPQAQQTLRFKHAS